MNARQFLPIHGPIAHHIHGGCLVVAGQLALPVQSNIEKADWSAAENCEATMAMAAQVLSLVNAMPDGPARRRTVRLLEAARKSYAQVVRSN
ncbi:hypothetical protein [Chromobacterium subtsugae]|uniref:hypothetical protein n=1 Tax=Chromobacterium subtsugae TaxID=251747 RepID=UPI0007F8EE91|nr:hypothetical protein [Chromobacterium subtsugae]OBU85459.1 hypothetical protein MY55_15860 [Chromobacterium subtsugae]